MKKISILTFLLIIAGFLTTPGLVQAKTNKPYIDVPEEEQVITDSDKTDKEVIEENIDEQTKKSNVILKDEAVVEEETEKWESKKPAINETTPEITQLQGIIAEPAKKELKPKSIILMVANGMGLSSYGIAKYYREFVENGSLAMEKVANQGMTGFLFTCSTYNVISDNPAASSALATGFKVKNGAISITADGKKPETVLEKMKNKGLSVGMVTTSEITDALTAAFSSHVESEDLKELIATQQLANQIDILMGGGEKWFDAGKRSDGKDLLELAQKMNYSVITSKNELSKIRANDTEKILGLFAERMLHFVSDNIKEEPTLAHMTRVALGVLKKNEKGFFLLVEGGRIAHAAHANMTGKMIREILAFDEAVGEVLGFLQSNPDTLLIITSNLEVGGPVLSKKVWDEKYVLKQDFKQILDDTKELIIWPTRNHTATPAIVFAKGPGSEGVTGVHDNTYLMKIMETEVPVVQVKEEITETTGQEQKELWIKEPKKTPVEIKGQKNEIQEIKKPGPDNEIKKHRRKKR